MKLLLLIIAFNFILFSVATEEFSYSNQEKWESYCSDGENQSPIKIDTSKIDESSSEFYQLLITGIHNHKDANIINEGVTLSSQGYWMEFTASDVNKRPRIYETENLKFHSPAEHKIDNIQPDLELQLMAKQTAGYSDGKINGILSLLFVEAAGDESAILSGFSNYLENQNSDGSHYQDVNLYDALFPLFAHFNSSLEYYTYQGSFTTPPCEETVNWYIVKNYFPISKRQLSLFQELWSKNQNFAEGAGNNRNLQSSSNRKIACGNVYVAKLNAFIINAILAVFVLSIFSLLI